MNGFALFCSNLVDISFHFNQECVACHTHTMKKPTPAAILLLLSAASCCLEEITSSSSSSHHYHHHRGGDMPPPPRKQLQQHPASMMWSRPHESPNLDMYVDGGGPSYYERNDINPTSAHFTFNKETTPVIFHHQYCLRCNN